MSLQSGLRGFRREVSGEFANGSAKRLHADFAEKPAESSQTALQSGLRGFRREVSGEFAIGSAKRVHADFAEKSAESSRLALLCDKQEF